MKIGEGLTTAQLIEMTKEGPVTMLRGAPGFKFVEKVDEVDGSTYTVIDLFIYLFLFIGTTFYIYCLF